MLDEMEATSATGDALAGDETAGDAGGSGGTPGGGMGGGGGATATLMVMVVHLLTAMVPSMVTPSAAERVSVPTLVRLADRLAAADDEHEAEEVSVTTASTLTLAAVTETSTEHAGSSHARTVRKPDSKLDELKSSTVPAAVRLTVNCVASTSRIDTPGR